GASAVIDRDRTGGSSRPAGRTDRHRHRIRLASDGSGGRLRADRRGRVDLVLRGSATGEFERADASVPGRCIRGGLIFLRVPESAVVTGIDLHRGVVAPAVIAGLRSETYSERSFRLQGAERIANLPSRIANRGVRSRARDAVAD